MNSKRIIINFRSSDDDDKQPDSLVNTILSLMSDNGLNGSFHVFDEQRGFSSREIQAGDLVDVTYLDGDIHENA